MKKTHLRKEQEKQNLQGQIQRMKAETREMRAYLKD